MSEKVRKAAAFAAKAHAGQLDKGGVPYILHPERVAAAVAEYGPEAQIVAWLHDTVEDTPVTLAEIEAEFGPVIAAAVDAISEQEDKESYEEYVKRCAQNPLAVVVKVADILDNKSEYRMGNLPPPKQEKLKIKYAKGLEILFASAL